MTTNIDDMITVFEVDVRFPDLSGMEHLDMLLNRSELARAEQAGQLSDEQRLRLAQADRILLEQVERFYGSIKHIADLESWRRQEDAPPEHWRWYLDVLAQVPSWPVRERSHVPAIIPQPLRQSSAARPGTRCCQA